MSDIRGKNREKPPVTDGTISADKILIHRVHFGRKWKLVQTVKDLRESFWFFLRFSYTKVTENGGSLSIIT